MLTLEHSELWSHEYDLAWLSGLTGGEPVVHFSATKPRLVREGLVARFSFAGQTWQGNFECGDGSMSVMTATPSPTHACIVAAGRGYWLPVTARESFEIVPAYPITQAVAMKTPSLLILADFTRVVAYGASGLQWISRAISWDGIRILQADDKTISGLAWDAPEEREVQFVIDPNTGEVRSGPEPPPPSPLRIV